MRLFLPVVTIISLLFQLRIAAQQRWTDSNGYTYEVYDVYAQGYYPQQQQQYVSQKSQQYYPQQQQYVPQNNQQYYPQQQNTAAVSMAEAQWVCTNTKTKDMMIITTEDIPRVFGGQTQQPSNPQQQPNPPQQQNPPQQLNYPQQPNYPQQQPNYPNQQPATPATTTTTTTTEEPLPVWPGGDHNQPIQPSAYSTTQKPLLPVWSTIAPIWPAYGDGNKPGFTPADEVTPKPKPVTPSDTSLDPLRPQVQPTKPSENQNDPNDYGEIQIEMGKK